MDSRELSNTAQHVVRGVLEKLPEELRRLAENVPVLLQDYPEASLRKDGIDEQVLGLFTGSPYGDDFYETQAMPPQIFLYLRNIWEMAEENPQDYRREVRLTYLHELGHYFGWDEDEIAARGLE